ncbi:stalk domain-containing protein [Paenibacillus sp. YYML68]|uniref:stalk domain-containing protein n=1 Tax=Paenibacillus sp. YYML68 TaxID=2909250 RepID=UPI0024928C43|nr:stalk domain-containing protein [Paenibacillus sp. YYML68]
MKKFILGMLCGAAIMAAPVVYAADGVWALLFPVKLQFNGEARELGPGYQILNVEGHTYVPLRFMAEQLGAGASYDPEKKLVSVEAEPQNGSAADKLVWAAQYRLERGNDGKAVKALFGEPSQLTWIDSSKQQIGRYDIGAKSGYKFSSLTATDIKGLESGDLQAQLFIHWTAGGLVDRYSLWYARTLQDGERILFTHNVFPDGSVSGAKYE